MTKPGTPSFSLVCLATIPGRSIQYLWEECDDSKHDLPAPHYIQRLLKWVNGLMENDAVFPSVPGQLFPDNFEAIVMTIMRRLFRIYAHCYYHHLDALTRLGNQAVLNTSFKHFLFVADEFHLIDRDQLDPLIDLVDEILRQE
jgi:MOB kinase activator 1